MTRFWRKSTYLVIERLSVCLQLLSMCKGSLCLCISLCLSTTLSLSLSLWISLPLSIFHTRTHTRAHIHASIVSRSLDEFLSYIDIFFGISMNLWWSSIFGAVHKVRQAIFGQFWPPLPVTLCHTSRDPTPKSSSHIWDPPFLVGHLQKTRTKAPCTNSFSIVRGGFCPGFLSFVWKVLSGVVFVRPPIWQNTSVTTEC